MGGEAVENEHLVFGKAQDIPVLFPKPKGELGRRRKPLDQRGDERLGALLGQPLSSAAMPGEYSIDRLSQSRTGEVTAVQNDVPRQIGPHVLRRLDLDVRQHHSPTEPATEPPAAEAGRVLEVPANGMDAATGLFPRIFDSVCRAVAIDRRPAVGRSPHDAALDFKTDRPSRWVQNQEIDFTFLQFATARTPIRTARRKQETLAVNDRPRVGQLGPEPFVDAPFRVRRLGRRNRRNHAGHAVSRIVLGSGATTRQVYRLSGHRRRPWKIAMISSRSAGWGDGGAGRRSPRSSGPSTSAGSGGAGAMAAGAVVRARPGGAVLRRRRAAAGRPGPHDGRGRTPVHTAGRLPSFERRRTPRMTRSTIRPLPGSRPRTGDRQRGPGRRADSEGWRGDAGANSAQGANTLQAGEVP